MMIPSYPLFLTESTAGTSSVTLSVGRLALYLLVMAGVTYLIRMIPFTLFNRQIRSRYLQSFLSYIPYAVLGAMTFPSIFYATSSFPSALVGTAVALILAFFRRSLLTVALSASAAALVTQCVIIYVL